MTSSVIALTGSEFETICERFGLSLHRASPLSGGVSTNYLFDAEEGRFVVSVLDRALGLEADTVVRLLDHLKENGLQVAAPCRSMRGKAEELVGDHVVSVKQFIPGTVHDVLPMGLLADAGDALAHVHAIPVPEWLPKRTKRLANLEGEMATWPDREFVEWVLRNAAIAESELSADNSSSLLHGDYFSDNVVVCEDGSIAIIDWEEATVDAPIRDLGFAALGMANIDGRLDLSRLSLLIEGYERVRRLADFERVGLRAAIIAAGVWTARRRYVRHHIHFPFPPMQRRFAEMQAFVDDLLIRWPTPSTLI